MGKSRPDLVRRHRDVNYDNLSTLSLDKLNHRLLGVKGEFSLAFAVAILKHQNNLNVTIGFKPNTDLRINSIHKSKIIQ